MLAFAIETWCAVCNKVNLFTAYKEDKDFYHLKCNSCKKTLKVAKEE